MWEVAKIVLMVLGGLFLVFILLFVFSAMKISGDISRQEEKREYEMMLEEIRRKQEQASSALEDIKEEV